MLPHRSVKLLALARRTQASVVEVEQLQPGGLAQFPQPAADGRLRGVEHLRGTRGRAGLHDGLEGLDLLEVERTGHVESASGHSGQWLWHAMNTVYRK